TAERQHAPRTAACRGKGCALAKSGAYPRVVTTPCQRRANEEGTGESAAPAKPPIQRQRRPPPWNLACVEARPVRGPRFHAREVVSASALRPAPDDLSASRTGTPTRTTPASASPRCRRCCA